MPTLPDLPTCQPPNRFGAHMPATGGLQYAILAGQEVGCDVVQVFTKSPMQWRAREIPDEEKTAFWQAQIETGIPAVVAHDTYLINPASDKPELLDRSRQALVEEMTRCAELRIPYVVMHLGACGSASEDEAMQRLVDSLAYTLDHSPDPGPTLLLETMAGQGKTLGERFEQLAHVLQQVDAGERLAVCLDTCHVFVAGYDLREPEAYADTMRQFDQTIGLEQIKIIHANDSKKELGSRVDRHEAIGQGGLGLAAFRHLLTDERLMNVPVLLETPKEAGMDLVNLAALREAAALPPPASPS